MECARWNFDANDSALLVCRNYHEKGDDCDMQPMHPADVLALVNELRAQALEADVRQAAAVAEERERCAKVCEAEAVFAGSNGKKDASAINCADAIRRA